MPNTKSAKKRLRQDEERRLHNRSKRSALRTAVKKVRSAVQAGDTQGVDPLFRHATKKADQLAAHNVIHANTAARIKSRLSAEIKRAKQAS